MGDTAPLRGLTVIIPSYGRPQTVARTYAAFRDTGALDFGVDVLYSLDVTDPLAGQYAREMANTFGSVADVHLSGSRGMVAAINGAGRSLLDRDPRPDVVAVLNDDHVPRSLGWAGAIMGALEVMGTGIVYGDDLLRGESLPTAWAMTTDIVEALGRVVPCLVEHLYADNAVADLGRAAGVLQYLPDVVVEHMHPTAGKAPQDEGYARVNSRTRWNNDGAKYRRWSGSARFHAQVAAVKGLLAARAAT